MTRSSTFRCIAGYVAEITLLIALRTNIRRCRGGNEEPAFTAFKISQPTLRADIPNESAFSCVAAMGAHLLFLILFHRNFLLSPPTLRSNTDKSKGKLSPHKRHVSHL